MLDPECNKHVHLLTHTHTHSKNDLCVLIKKNTVPRTHTLHTVKVWRTEKGSVIIQQTHLRAQSPTLSGGTLSRKLNKKTQHEQIALCCPLLPPLTLPDGVYTPIASLAVLLLPTNISVGVWTHTADSVCQYREAVQKYWEALATRLKNKNNKLNYILLQQTVCACRICVKNAQRSPPLHKQYIKKERMM